MNETLRLNALLRRVLSGMKPPENLTVSQWAEKHRRLSSETAAEPGHWRNVRTPCLRDIMRPSKLCRRTWTLSTGGCKLPDPGWQVALRQRKLQPSTPRPRPPGHG